MSEEIGVISYVVKAETAQAIASTKQFNKNLSDMESKVGKTDKAIGGLNTSLTKVAGAVAAAIGVQQLMQLQKLSEGFNLLRSRVNRLSQDAASATDNFNSLLQIANRTGASVADTVKLWEGLTATLKEFGATSGDVQVLVETLQKIGVVGGSSADEMSNALRQLGQAISGGVLRAEEFNSIIEQMPELGRQIAAGLGIPFSELRQQMLDGELTSQKVLGAIYKQVGTVNAEFAKMPRTVAQASNALVNSFGDAVSRVDAEIGASKNIAKFLDLLAKGVEVSFSKELQDRQRFNDLLAERQKLQESINTVERNSPTSTTQLEVMRNRYAAINDELRKMQDAEKKRIQDASKGEQKKDRPDYLKNIKSTGADKGDKKAATEQDRINRVIEEAKLKTQQLNAQYAALYATEEKVTSGKLRHTEASARLEAQQKLSSGASKEQIDALAKEIYAQDQMAEKLDARIDRQKKLDEAKKKSIEQAAKDRELQDKFDPVAGATNKYAEESAMLLDARQKDIITEDMFQMQKDALATQYEQKRLAAAEELYRAQSDGNAFIMDSVNALGQASTSTISGLLSGTMSATEAMQNFANIILNQAVGALVGMGIEYVKQQLLQQTMAASASAAQVAIAATTGTAMAAAYAPAAAMASLASFGANAAPAQAGIASTVAMSSGLALAGGRQYGGPVNPGSMYRVGEGNTPELVSSGGSSYMIAGSRGKVTPMDGASGGVTFNITNNASDMVQTQQSYDPETRTVELAITAVANQMNTRTGKVGQAMKNAGAYSRLG
jgi:tape measure domain-containing protein